MLEKILRARLPEQIVALIEHLEQNPDASHLEKLDRFLFGHEPHLTRFEHWMIRREMSKVRRIVKRDALLRNAMSIVINEPEEKEYDANTYRYVGINNLSAAQMSATATHIAQHAQLAQQAQIQKTWTDPRSLF